MATSHNTATPAMNTLGEDGLQSVPFSPEQVQYIRQRPLRDDHRFVRADSEPINVSCHPELYDKLNALWQQASTLITSNNLQQQSSISPAPSETMDLRTPTNGQSTPSVSIVDLEIFKILYTNPLHLRHFSITKQELPFHETVHNREYMEWVATKEPGIKINYTDIRTNLTRLSKEQLLRQNSPNVFNFFNSLLRAHDVYVLRGARFLSYDLHASMVDAYYGAPGDVALLSRFPVTEPSAFQEYIATSSKAMSEQAQNNRRRNRAELYEQWREAESALMNIKSGREFFRRQDQLHKLMKIFRNRFEERAKRNRALRSIQANRKVDKKKVIKSVNINTWREQVGQSGMHDLDDHQVLLLQTRMLEQSQTYNLRHKTDDTTGLPGQMQGMKINDNSDGNTISPYGSAKHILL